MTLKRWIFKETDNMGKIIGIDLGTSNSAAAVMVGGKPTIIQAAEGTSIGGKAFPSVVAFTKDGQLIVGEPARRQMISSLEYTAKNTLRSKYPLSFCKRSKETPKRSLEKRSTGQSLPCLHTLMIINARRPRMLEKLQVFK